MSSGEADLLAEVLDKVLGCDVTVDEIEYGSDMSSRIVKCGCQYADHAVVSRKAIPVHEDVGEAWWMLGQLADDYEEIAGYELDCFSHEDRVICRIHWLSRTTTPRKLTATAGRAAPAACKAALKFVEKMEE